MQTDSPSTPPALTDDQASECATLVRSTRFEVGDRVVITTENLNLDDPTGVVSQHHGPNAPYPYKVEISPGRFLLFSARDLRLADGQADDPPTSTNHGDGSPLLVGGEA